MNSKKDEEVKEIFLNKLNELSKNDKMLFALYFYEGLSVKEIAFTLETPVAQVKEDFITALYLLEKKLAEEGVNLGDNELVVKLCNNLKQV